MALINCKECGEKISKKASSCPKCGAPTKKKGGLGCGGLIAVLFLLFIIGFIVSTFIDSENATNTSPQNRQEATQKLNIESASKVQKNLVQSALGNKYPISKIAVVKSKNHAKAYYIGAVFNATGVGKVTGIWLIGGEKENPNLLFSVDGTAYEFSGMGKASKIKAAAYSTDPEAIALKDFLNN